MTEKKSTARSKSDAQKEPEAPARKTRVRRTKEQRLADLERKRLEILERQKTMLATIEEQKKALLNKPVFRKEEREKEKRFARALRSFAPDWEYSHVMAAIELALSEDRDRLQVRGTELLEEHGKPRRGRKPKKI